jgi:hypothetical protein
MPIRKTKKGYKIKGVEKAYKTKKEAERVEKLRHFFKHKGK